MTLEEARAKLPLGYTIKMVKGNGFWRCVIANDVGQPQGIGDADTQPAAIVRALESLRTKAKI